MRDIGRMLAVSIVTLTLAATPSRAQTIFSGVGGVCLDAKGGRV